MRALRIRLGQDSRVTVLIDRATRIVPSDDDVVVTTERTGTMRVRHVVIAAGAWVNEIRGLPRQLPVEPVRGQMIAIAGAPLRHVVMGGHAYAVPRGEETHIGATMEHVGFEATTTSEAAEKLVANAQRLIPGFKGTVVRQWAGLRPLTPDMLPIIGRDADRPRVIWACGHSRNGILMAPLTGDVIARLILGVDPGYDLSPFAPERLEPSKMR